MIVELKCGERVEFYNIKQVNIFNHEIVKINGNTEKGKRRVNYQTHVRAIKNIKEFNRFLKKEMKFYQCDGVCEYCGSFNVQERGQASYFKKLNEPKEKKKYEKHEISGYKCNACGKLFSDLKPADLVIYHR